MTNKLADITLHGASACLGILLMTQPDVNFIDPNAPTIKKTFKDGMPAVRVETQKGQPYPLKSYGAFLLAGHSLAIALKVCGKDFFSDTYADVLGIFQGTAENPEPLRAIANVPKIIRGMTIKNPDDDLNVDELISNFLNYPNSAIVGNPGSGKTSFMRKVLSVYLNDNPTADLLICDPAVGKEGNSWLNLVYGDSEGKKIVFSQIDEIVDIINQLYREMMERSKIAEDAVRTGKHRPQFTKTFCIFDEFSVTTKILKTSGQLDELLPKIEQILLLGRGYDIKLVLGMQNPSTRDNALGEAFIAGLNKCWLIKDVLKEGLLTRYFPLNLKEDEDQQAFNKLNQLRRAGKYCMMIGCGGNKFVLPVPDYRNLPDLVVNPYDQSEILKRWWSDTLATHEPEAMRMIDDFLAKKRKSPLTEIADLMSVRPAKDNPKYTDYLRPWFDEKTKQLIEV
jgi:hypothetical protein